MRQLIAVYGSLRAGCCGHHLLAEMEYLGQEVYSGLCLYNLGPYPAAIAHPNTSVTLELYRIDAQTLARLDDFEDYLPDDPAASLYRRDLIQSRYGQCWIYLYNRPLAGYQPVQGGDWRAHCQTGHCRFPADLA